MKQNRSIRSFWYASIVAPSILWIASSAGITGCASNRSRSAQAESDKSDSQKIQDLQTQQAQIQTVLSGLRTQLDGIEGKISSMNDKLATTQSNLNQLLGQTKPKTETVAPAADSLAGTPVTVGARDTREDGFVSNDAVQAYRKAMILFESKSYPEAVLAFSTFVDQYPDHPLAGSAQYFLGESYFKQGEYKLARREFQRVLTTYDHSPHIPDTLKDLAACEQQLNDNDSATRHRQLLTSLFPQSPAASEPLSETMSHPASADPQPQAATPHASSPSGMMLDTPPTAPVPASKEIQADMNPAAQQPTSERNDSTKE